MIASKAGSGPIPLRWRIFFGMGPAPAEKLRQGDAFALGARGWDDRFQSSLRPDPAAVGVA